MRISVPATQSTGLKVLKKNPRVFDVSDVLYIPRFKESEDKNFGLYNKYGRLIQESAIFRNSCSDLIGHNYITMADPVASHEIAYGNGYFYGGNIGTHYGHFLTETLPRFWCAPELYNGKKIVFHTPKSLDEVFSLPWVDFLFSCLGLHRECSIKFDKPTIVEGITISEPAFGENHYAHHVYAKFMNKIGGEFHGYLHNSRPIYLSKSKLKTGLYSFEGEEIIEGLLRREGFNILYPERLSLPQQLALFQSDKIISGIIGSAFHNSIFSPSPSGIAICPGHRLSSNYHLMDAVNNGNIKYIGVDCDAISQKTNLSFHHQVKIIEPESVAGIIIDYAAGKDIATETEMYIDSPSESAGIYDVFTRFGFKLMYDRQTGIIGSLPDSQQDPQLGNLNVTSNGPHISMKANEEGRPIGCLGEHFQEHAVSFNVIQLDSNTVYLMNAVTGRYLSAQPNGEVLCNRSIASDWEQFRLEKKA